MGDSRASWVSPRVRLIFLLVVGIHFSAFADHFSSLRSSPLVGVAKRPLIVPSVVQVVL